MRILCSFEGREVGGDRGGGQTDRQADKERKEKKAGRDRETVQTQSKTLKDRTRQPPRLPP